MKDSNTQKLNNRGLWKKIMLYSIQCDIMSLLKWIRDRDGSTGKQPLWAALVRGRDSEMIMGIYLELANQSA